MYYLIDAQRKIAPEALEMIDKRYTILKEVYFSKVIGRRLLAGKLNLSERVIRNEIDFMKEENLVEIQPLGISITDLGIEILDALEGYIAEIRGLAWMAEALKEELGIKEVMIAPVSLSQSPYALDELGQMASKYFFTQLKGKEVIGLTGGYTLKAFAEQMPQRNYPEMLIVPARGGLGEILEIQSNTIVSNLARKLNASYKLLQIPDNIDEGLMEHIFADPGIKSTYDQIKNMDLLVFGIGNAKDLSKRRNTPKEEWTNLEAKGAVAESFGYYFDIHGQIVYETGTVGIKLDQYKQMENIVAIAAGGHKADAILSISKINKNLVLIIDEDAAKEIVDKLKIKINGGIK